MHQKAIERRSSFPKTCESLQAPIFCATVLRRGSVSYCLWQGHLKSYRQNVEHEEDQPPQHPTDGADEYGEDVDGDRGRKDQVRQEDEDYTEDPVNSEPG